MEQASNDISELFSALAKAQAEMGTVSKDATNPHLKNRYSTLTSVVDAIRAPLTSNGICWTHQSVMVEGVHYIRTVLGHSSGQWIASDVPVELGRGGGPQGMGSGITYAKRYGLQSLVGVCSADEDDDGASAQKAANDRRRNPGPHERPHKPVEPKFPEALAGFIDAIERCNSVQELEAVRPNGTLSEHEREQAAAAWRKRKEELSQPVSDDGFGW